MERNTLPPESAAPSLEELYVEAGELPQIQAEEGSWFVSFLRVALVVGGVIAFFDHIGYNW